MRLEPFNYEFGLRGAHRKRLLITKKNNVETMQLISLLFISFKVIQIFSRTFFTISNLSLI